MTSQAHIFVSCLSTSVTSSDVSNHLSSKAKVANVSLRNGKIPGTQIGFITLEDENQTSEVLKLNESFLKGQKIKLQPYSKSKPSVEKTGVMNGGHKFGEMTVSITYVHSADEFYIQLKDEASHLNNISAWMVTSAPTAKKMRNDSIKTGFIYGAPYTDGAYYRVKVLSQNADNKFKVKFIDFGNVEEMEGESLLFLPREISNIIQLAHRCNLHNLLIIDKKQVKEIMDNFTGIELKAKLFKETQLTWSVDLYLDGGSVCDDLVSRNWARYMNQTFTNNNDSKSETKPSSGFHVSPASSTSNHTTDRSVSDAPTPTPKSPIQKLENVVFTSAQNLQLYLQGSVPDSVEKISKISELMQHVVNAASMNGSALPSLEGRMFVTRFSEDNDLYRCIVLNPPAGKADRVTVRYVDFGNSEEVATDQLIPVPQDSELAQIPVLAVRCFLIGAGLVPSPNDSTALENGKEADLQAELNQICNVCVSVEYYRDKDCLYVEDAHTDDIPSLKARLIEKNILKNVVKANIREMNEKYQKLELNEKCKTVGGAENMLPAPMSKSYQGLVSHIDSLSDIFIQNIQDESDPDKISEWMSTQNTTFNSIQMPLDHSRYYGGIFKQDDHYYRIKILEEKDNQVYGQFIDFGNCDYVDKNTLVELPPTVRDIAPLIKQCSLKTLLTSEKEPELVNFLKEKLLNQPAICLETDDKVTDLMLDDGNVSMVQLLVSEGLAKRIPVKQISPVKPPYSSFKQPPTKERTNNPPKINKFQADKSPQSRPILGTGNHEANNVSFGSGYRPPARKSHPLPNRQTFPNNKPASINKTTKNPPQSPQKPLVKSEPSVDTKLFEKIFFGRLKLTQFRSFFSDDESNTLASSVLDLLTSCKEFNDVTTLKDRIFQLNEEYKAQTEKIASYCNSCDSNWEGVADLLIQRDALCHELVDLVDCYPSKINEVHSDIESFTKQLQNKMIRLKECESLFVSSNVSKMSDEEIQSRMVTLMDYYACSPLGTLKSDTDKAELMVQECFKGINEVMHNQPGCIVNEFSDNAKNMWHRCNAYHSAIEKELHFYEQSTSNCLDLKYRILISDVLKSLRIKVEVVLKDINEMEKSRDIICKIGEDCKFSLSTEERPDKALQAKNRVKSLRSKLRHTLADLADLMESSNPAKEDYEQFQSSALQLRREIHRNLIVAQRESQFLLDLMEYKPELQVKYKELNLLEAKRIYRTWDLFYFYFEPLSDQKNIFLSEFNSEPVLIHKVTMSPSEIEQKIIKFKKFAESSSSLFLPIEEVFVAPAEVDVVYVIHRHNPLPDVFIQKLLANSKVFIRFIQRLLSALKLLCQNNFGYTNFSMMDLFFVENISDSNDDDEEGIVNKVWFCPPSDIYAMPGTDFCSVKKTCQDVHTTILKMGDQLDMDLQNTVSQYLPSYCSMLDLSQAIQFWQVYYDDIIAKEQAEKIRQEILREEATKDKVGDVNGDTEPHDPASVPLPLEDIDSGDEDEQNDSVIENSQLCGENGDSEESSPKEE